MRIRYCTSTPYTQPRIPSSKANTWFFLLCLSSRVRVAALAIFPSLDRVRSRSRSNQVVRLVLVGSCDTGKTCLLRRFLGGYFDEAGQQDYTRRASAIILIDRRSTAVKTTLLPVLVSTKKCWYDSCACVVTAPSRRRNNATHAGRGLLLYSTGALSTGLERATGDLT